MQDLIAWLDAAGSAPLMPVAEGESTVSAAAVPRALDAVLREADRDMLWCMIMCPDDGKEDGDAPESVPEESPEESDGDDGDDEGKGRRGGA